MPELTVCVPAYRSEHLLPQTLASVQAQTFVDFHVDIAVEPDGAEAVESACGPFLTDRRFRLVVDPTTLGWDGNVRALLSRVETPYFAVLPHDDLWHSRYLETLVVPLRHREDVLVCYPDMFLYGEQIGRRGVHVPDMALGPRLLAFFLEGAEGTPWHGVTRREALVREFPGNEYAGLAVEVEWALHLVRLGPPLHLPEALYMKRSLKEGSVSSWWRFGMPEDTLRRALAHHADRVLAEIPDDGLNPIERRQVRLAAEAAMLRRWVIFSRGRLRMTDGEIASVERVITEAADPELPAGSAIQGQAMLALSRYRHSIGEHAESERLARAAVAASPGNWDARAHLARLLLLQNRPEDALAHLVEACRLYPMAVGLDALVADCSRRIGTMRVTAA